MRQLWRQILQTSGANGAYVLGTGVVLFITARVLGPDGRGEYAVLTGWVLLFSMLGSLSLGQVVLHRLTEQPGRESASSAFGGCLAICGAVVVAGWAGVAAAYVLTDGNLFRHLTASHLALAFLALPFLIVNTNLPYLLYSVGAIYRANLAQVIGAIVAVAATALLVAVLRLGLPGALVAFVLGSATTAAAIVAFVISDVSRPRFDWPMARTMVGRSAQLHMNAVGTYLFTQTSVLILNHFRPLEESAYYQLAVQLFTLSLLISTSMGTVTYALVSKNGPDAAWPQQRRLIMQAVLLMIGGALPAFFLAPVAVALVAGPAFAPAVPLFRMMLPATIGGTFSAMMASQWIGRGFFWQAAVVSLIVGVISVALDLALIPGRGMYGAVVSTLVTYALSAAVNGAMAIWIDRRVARQSAPTQ